MRKIIRFLKNLPISAKLTLLLIGVVMICTIGSSAYTYHTIKKSLNLHLGQRLEHIASTASLMIPGEVHEQIVQGYSNHDLTLKSRPHFNQVQQVLVNIQKQNNLELDVSTFIHPDWSPNTLIFIAMSNPKTYIGNGFPANPAAVLTLEKGIPTHSELQIEKEGTWISGYAPIKTQSGKTVGAIGIDYRADKEIFAARIEVLKNLQVTGLIGILLSIFLGIVVGRSLSQPLKRLNSAAVEVARGHLDAHLESNSTDEIGTLVTTFNTLVSSLRKNQKDISEYSHNLELKVGEKAAVLKPLQQVLDSILQNSDQGILVFGPDGICKSTHSHACEQLLEIQPEGKSIGQVLQQPEGPTLEWFKTLFVEDRPFEEKAAAGPQSFQHLKAKKIHLEYKPVRDENQTISGILMISKDKTLEYEAIRSAEQEKAYSQMIKQLTQNKDQFLSFIQDAKLIFLTLEEELKKSKHQPANIDLLLVSMQRIRQGATTFSLKQLKTVAQSSEGILEKMRSSDDSKVQEIIPRLNSDLAALKEAVHDFLEENKELFGNAIHDGNRRLDVSVMKLMEFSEKLSKDPKIQSEFIQNFIEEPIQKFFIHFDEVIARLASQQNKEVKPIQFKGGKLHVVAQPYASLFSAILHAFQNSILHGIELPEQRRAVGKNPEGTLSMYFAKQATNGTSHFKLVIQDDGCGIEPQKLPHIFKGGLKTIREAAVELGGTAEVLSKVGKGTLLTITVPDLKRTRAS